ncbi:esterase/lipase family protein [Leptospira levettii]|uniref:GPI inositol-deacylase n=1 Tax=Leptospira levettii TaxID=2023178 RepID=A0AAW5V8B7_9LEPT|nr:alpha/beta hydrolase [Leptospira levettii]MCW7467424.1 GPI inositol-deacylase [Leptospira levettii]MCW7513146.1 GPI inositol-deacylase [Leptospira levettii]MCW7516720.1 GPI inositol-deacylase [Leptospira levettii]TGM89044.1 alpha/beta hydrolase [Leptospira levettii]
MFRFMEYLERFWALVSFYLPSHLSIENNQDKNILIVPGFRAGRFFYARLKSNLYNLGFKVGILSTLRNPSSLEEAIQYLAKQILTAPNEVTLIAHNTGGLLVLILPDEARRKVKRLITLGTPFHGSDRFTNTRFSYWGFESDWVKTNYKNALFFPLFQPLSAIEDFSFPPQESTEFGQGRDLWFDIPGNYNLVRRNENIRTLREFLGTPKDNINITPSPKANPDFAVPKKIEVDFSKYEPAVYKKNKESLAKKKSSSNKELSKPTPKKAKPNQKAKQTPKPKAKPKKKSKR